MIQNLDIERRNSCNTEGQSNTHVLEALIFKQVQVCKNPIP